MMEENNVEEEDHRHDDDHDDCCTSSVERGGYGRIPQDAGQNNAEDDYELQELLLIDRVIKQNSYSAFLLHSGEDCTSKMAIKILSDALTCMKRIVLLAMRGQDTTQKRVEDEAAQEFVMTEGIAMANELSLFPNTSLPLNGLQDSKYFIYNCTVTISDFQTYSRSRNHPTVYTSCLLLNLALAHHCLGVNGDSASFSKAAKLYSKGLQLLALAPPETPQVTVLSLMILAMNNIAHVHNAMGQHQESTTSISQLSALLRIVHTAASPCTFFSPCDVHRFTLNAMLGCMPKTAGAA
jgi:hypothetical protein